MPMTIKELEAEVKQLKKKVAEGARAKDYLEICQLQSMYSHLYYIGMRSEIPSLFAQKTPGVTLEIEDSGVYEGIESVKRFWTKVLGTNAAKAPGMLAIHMTVNPIIEINKAGTKAKGLWHSHGYCSFVQGERYKQFICLGKYDMEYVKEDGKWKILKFAYRQAFMAPYEKGWVEEPVAASITDSPASSPDRPLTYYMPYNRYRINVFEPPPPEPYQD